MPIGLSAMSVADAKRAVQIGCTGVVVSNHGGRQLDGSRAAFDQLAEIVDAIVDRTAWLPDCGTTRRSLPLQPPACEDPKSKACPSMLASFQPAW